MKKMKKLASLLLASVMALSMTATAFAAETTQKPSGEETKFWITVNNPNDSISMVGQEYTAYKLFNVTYNESHTAFAYTIADGFEDFSYNEKAGDELIAYVGTLTGEALNTFAEAALKHAIDENGDPKDGIIAKKAFADKKDTVTIDLTEEGAGYYLVGGSAFAANDQTVVAACALTTTQPNAEVTVKADAPSIEKKIVEGETTTDANNAAVGDMVTYRLTSQVPNMVGYEKYYFIVNDTMSKGLAFQDGADNVTVTIGDDELTYGTDYVVTVEDRDATTGSQNIKIVFNNFIQYRGRTGDDGVITIEYKAQITEDAVLGSAGNPNEVTLKYSNNPNVNPKGDNEPGPDDGDVTGETPKDIVITYVTGIKLTKYDGEKPDNTLAGAQFEITGEKLIKVKTVSEVFEEAADGNYYALATDPVTYTTVVPNDSNRDKYLDPDVKYNRTTKEEWITKATDVQIIGVTGTDGILRFDGLAEGAYTITEIKAPNGYNMLDKAIIVNITCTEPADDTISTGEETATWAVTGENLPDNGTVAVGTDGIITLNVPNLTGAQLPSTGGIGTTIFYAAGIILMAGAVFFVIRRRRA